MFTDTHAHVNFDSFDDDRQAMLQRAAEAKVNRIINIGLGPDTSQIEKAYATARDHAGMYLAAGVHPHDAKDMKEEVLTYLRKLVSQPKVIAIGEIGLDYHYDNSPREEQRECFRQLLDLALEIKLPVSIHSREAFADTFAICQEKDVFQKVGGVMHCFTGSAEEATQHVKQGAYISFSGILTFKKANALREAAQAVPLDRLLIETDSPYLAPDPHRGKRNEPAYVVRVAETLAGLRGLSLSEVAQLTSENATRLFRLA